MILNSYVVKLACPRKPLNTKTKTYSQKKDTKLQLQKKLLGA